MHSRVPRAVHLSRRSLLLASLAIPLTIARCERKKASRQQVVDLLIESDGDFLAFKPDTLTCPTGALIRLTFHHRGKFLSARHDWVLVLPGQMEAVDKDVEQNEGTIPQNDSRVIAWTPMCDKGGMVMAQFTAPAPGDYPFFCSTPGHGECMNGILHVTG